MKILINLFILTLFSFSSLMLEAKEKPAAKEAASKALSFTEVAKNTADILCKKADECSKEKLPASECHKETQDAFTQAYGRLPKEIKFEVSKEENYACIKVIEKSTCQELASASKLPGCEYIEKLNQ